MNRFDWQWPAAVVFSVVFSVVGVLVWVGKLPPDAIVLLMAWLVPSPMQVKGKEQQ